MGTVWRAHDEQLDREVALKELRLPDDLDASGREAWIGRLDREARAAARLKHPGVITVHDRTTGDDGRPWIVMELVHGRSLDDLIKDEGRLRRPGWPGSACRSWTRCAPYTPRASPTATSSPQTCCSKATGWC
nr:hypothetical protein [Streptomyces sp. MMG1064]